MIGPVYLTRASECLFSLAGLLRMGTPHGHQSQWTQLSLPGYDTRDQTHGTREPLYSFKRSPHVINISKLVSVTIYWVFWQSLAWVIMFVLSSSRRNLTWAFPPIFLITYFTHLSNLLNFSAALGIVLDGIRQSNTRAGHRQPCATSYTGK